VNGNGVRAAGNPDEEPNLSAYPSCPPLSSQPLDLNQLSIERRTDTESLSSMTEQYIFGRNNIRINESVSSIDDDRPARSDTENNSLNSSVTCNDDNIDVEIGLDGSLLRMPPLSPSCEVGNQVGVRDSSRQDNFPVKLQRILDELEHDGLTDVISWLPHGRAFMVHNVDRFVQEILPLHFNQTKYTSFQRQLHMYHITRVVQGPDKGAYFHYQLLRSQPELSKRLRRTCTTSTPENGTSKITGSLISHRSSGSDIPKDPKLRAASSITSCPS
jgi:HSF-type DNA-binding